jgi:RNA-directed DNA polymerase
MRHVSERFRQCGLEIYPDKSSIFYCEDANRTGDYSKISFDFLDYTLHPRRCVNSDGQFHANFFLTISRDSTKEINRRIRIWWIQLKNEKSLFDVSRVFNPILRAWYAYYGHFYPSALGQIWNNFHRRLVRWIRMKFRRFCPHSRRAWRFLARFARAHPDLFNHWRLGVFPCGWMIGAGWAERFTYGSRRGRGWNSLGLLNQCNFLYYFLLKKVICHSFTTSVCGSLTCHSSVFSGLFQASQN